MDTIILILIVIILIIYLNTDVKEKFITSTNSTFRKNLLGPCIIGNHTVNDNVQKFKRHSDPIIFYDKDKSTFIDNYNNNNIDNFLEHNQKESIVYASLKQTLFETKYKLNEDNTKYNFQINGFQEVNDVDTKLILKYINKIIDSININLDNNYKIKLANKNTKKMLKKKDELYFIDFTDKIDIYDEENNKINIDLTIIIQLLSDLKNNYIVSLGVAKLIN